MTAQSYIKTPVNGKSASPLRKSRKRKFDLFVFCRCGRAGGRLHGIAPGCPGMADERLQLVPGDAPGTIRSHYDPDFVPQKPDAQGRVRLLPSDDEDDVPTADVVASFLAHKQHRRVKKTTLRSYEKKLRAFCQQFPALPDRLPPILDFLAQFRGESGRYRKEFQATLKALYRHGVQCHGVPKNVLDGVDSPIVRKKAIRTLGLDQVRALLATPESDQDLAALHLLVGHGWRQVEVRRVTAADVRGTDKGRIWCRGKERDEWAPILPETLAALERLAGDKPDDATVLLGQRKGRPAPLGETGMSRLTGRLFRRANLQGYTGHDLRRTFATLVTEASGDEVLAMRLARDKVPGVSDRYVNRDLTGLLARYSPIRQAALLPSQKNGTPPPEQTGETANRSYDDGWWRRGRVELPVQKAP